MRSSLAAASPPRLPLGVATDVLVSRALAGDRSAEGLLYRRHAPAVLAMSIRLLRSAAAAEDAVHDAFMLGFERLAQLKNREQFGGWVLAIAVSVARKRLRRERLLSWVGIESLADAPLHVQALPSTSVEARGELAVLDAHLQRMSTERRLAWTLRHVEGFALEEIAGLMGVSVSTVKRLVNAAQGALSKHVSFGASR